MVVKTSPRRGNDSRISITWTGGVNRSKSSSETALLESLNNAYRQAVAYDKPKSRRPFLRIQQQPAAESRTRASPGKPVAAAPVGFAWTRQMRSKCLGTSLAAIPLRMHSSARSPRLRSSAILRSTAPSAQICLAPVNGDQRRARRRNASDTASELEQIPLLADLEGHTRMPFGCVVLRCSSLRNKQNLVRHGCELYLYTPPFGRCSGPLSRLDCTA